MDSDLIARARYAIGQYDTAKAKRYSPNPERLADLLAEAVAVLEAAQKPADDEREAHARIVAVLAGAGLATHPDVQRDLHTLSRRSESSELRHLDEQNDRFDELHPEPHPEPQWVRCSECRGDYPRDTWPGSQYDDHWDTCPNRPCGANAVGGFCILPRGHNMGQADVPDNHMSREALAGPTVVQYVGRRGGKTQALIESMLAQANERGIRVEVVHLEQSTDRENCGAPHPYAGEPCTLMRGHSGGHGNAERAWLADATDHENGGES